MTAPNTDPDLGWVRVEDALPDDETLVVLWCNYAFELGYRDAGEWFEASRALNLIGVTHWRNPFEPPEADA